MTHHVKALVFRLTIATLAGLSTMGYTFAQGTGPDIPGLNAWMEKGGVFALAGYLMWWVLGKLSKQIDRMIDSVDNLTGKIDDKLK